MISTYILRISGIWFIHQRESRRLMCRNTILTTFVVQTPFGGGWLFPLPRAEIKKNQVFMVSFTVTILIILWSEIVKNRKGCSSWYVGFSFTHYVHKIFCTLNRKLQLSLSIVVPFDVTFQIFIFSFRTSAVS